MSYEPSKVPQVQEFLLRGEGKHTLMICMGCREQIVVHDLRQAVAQADLHEQEKHLVDLYEVPGEVPQAV